MAVSIKLTITQNSQSVANNTSNVTVKVTASWTGGSHNAVVNASGTPQAFGSVTIDGKPYSFASTFNEKKTSSGSQTICTKTVDVSHNSDGTKTLYCSASYTTGVSSGTVKTGTVSKVLTRIPRKSTLAASNGTLDTQQTLTVTKQDSSFTHTITYTCGSASGNVCTKSSSTSISWTPPISLASQNTTGTTVSVKFTITTYSGSTNVGSNTKTITCSIPASVKPSCTISVSDPQGYASTYGGYLKGLSKFKVTITPTLAYGSDIASYSTSANGVKYTASSFTTGVLTSYGDSVSISTTIKDKRGRSGTKSATVKVLNYKAPAISNFKVTRCNADGTANDLGESVKVTFSYTATSLSSKNTCKAALKYKKSTASSYTTPSDFSNHSGEFSVTNATYVFAADTSSSYDVVLTVTDNFKSASSTQKVSTGFALMHWKANGKGMGIGKLSENDDTLDIGFKTRMRQSLTFDNGMGVYGTTTTGTVLQLAYINANNNTVVGYGGHSTSTGATNLYGNVVNITSKATSQYKQESQSPGIYVEGRRLSSNNILWSGARYMGSDQSITLGENVSAQANGIILAWSKFDSATQAAENSNFTFTFVPRGFVEKHAGVGVTTICASATLNVVAAKYVYVSDKTITGYAQNNADPYTANTGIDVTPRYFVLRYVIGV